MTGSQRYAAFLRGINVGGSKKVPMDRLKQAIEEIGCKNVRTFLASGNVTFDSPVGQGELLSAIENKLANTFGFPISTLLFNISDIDKMVESVPFHDIDVAAETKLYVTLLNRKAASNLSAPYVSPDGSFRITKISDRAVFFAVTDKNARTVDVMAFIEKEFGKDVTTRNWNTILKITGK